MSVLLYGVLAGATLAGIVVIAPAVKQATDLAPFLYANTRCSARTGSLLTQNTYSEMLASSSVQELYGILEDTAYSNIVEHSKNFVSFSKSLDKQMCADYDWLKGIVPKELIKIIKTLQLKYEIADIKSAVNRIKKGTVVSSVSSNSSSEKENTEFALNFIADDDLRYKVQSATDFNSLVSAFEGSPYQSVFTGVEADETEKITTGLDYFYIKKVLSVIRDAPKKSAEAFLDYWRHVVDMFNVRLVFRKLNLGRDDMDFIEGGFLNVKALSGVGDLSQLEGLLRDSPYSKHFTEINSLQVEISFTKVLKELASLLNARHPLHAGYVIRYIILKENEIKAVNMISKLKEENFDEDEIRKLLVI